MQQRVDDKAPHFDVSVDLETFGTGHDAMILSIGAVKFDARSGDTAQDLEGEVGNMFYRVIDLEAPGGGTITPSTVLWWMKQSDEARRLLTDPEVERVPLSQALVEFSEWLGFGLDPASDDYPNVTLWQRGNLDQIWLESAYKGCYLKAPWGFWQWRDQRTLLSLLPKHLFSKKWVAHDALTDAIGQAGHILQAFGLLGETLDNIKTDAYDESVRETTLGLGYTQGFTTVGEAVSYLEENAAEMFVGAAPEEVVSDLHNAFSGMFPDDLIVDHMSPEMRARLDAEMAAAPAEQPAEVTQA